MKKEAKKVKAIMKSSMKSPKSKMVSGKNFSRDLEEYDDKISDEDNFPSRKPADISGALARASKQMEYSKKPRVKLNRVGKGK